MKKNYEKPILEEEKIEIEDIVAASSTDVSQPGIWLPRWGNNNH